MHRSAQDRTNSVHGVPIGSDKVTQPHPTQFSSTDAQDVNEKSVDAPGISDFNIRVGARRPVL
jgi:hypothetical protein